jgi:hypothetical protein
MSNDPSPNREPRISEPDLRRILDRAIQLDAERTTDVTISELRRLAEEIGISPVALTQAIDEHQLGRLAVPAPVPAPEPRSAGWLQRARRLLRPALIGAAGTLVGTITAMTGEDGAALVTFFMTIVASLVLAVFHRLRRREAVEAGEAGLATPEQLLEARNAGWSFQIDLLALWVPWSVLNAMIDEEIFAVGGLTWMAAALIGMGIVTLINPKPKYPLGENRAPRQPEGPAAAV